MPCNSNIYFLKFINFINKSIKLFLINFLLVALPTKRSGWVTLTVLAVDLMFTYVHGNLSKICSTDQLVLFKEKFSLIS